MSSRKRKLVAQSKKKKRCAGLEPGSLYQPPTHSELQALRETQELFSSNLMRLQIRELLTEVSIPATTSSAVEQLLHSVQQFLTSLPSSRTIDLSDAPSLLDKAQYPLNLDLSRQKGNFQFIAPSVVKVVGGFLLGTLCRPQPAVDLSVHIPTECLQAKDILNYHYFHKRALYLSLIAEQLLKHRKSLSLDSIKFSSHNPLLPTLVLTAHGGDVVVNLHTSIASDELFQRSRLSPGQSNVGPDASPLYNCCLLQELGSRERHLASLYSCLAESPSLQEVVILCKVWARQRNLSTGYGRITGFHFSILLSWLFAQRKVNSQMSCYQVFRIILQSLVDSDWTAAGVSLGKQFPVAAYHSVHDVVFVDECGVNVLAELSGACYQWLRTEAGQSLSLLDTGSFQALFMTPLTPHLTFDLLCTVAISRDPSGPLWQLPLLISRVIPILTRALANRVKLVTVLACPHGEWSVRERPPDQPSQFTLALLLDTEHAFSTIELGPPADSPEANSFKEFWGEVAKLRRFKDGSLREAVLWKPDQCIPVEIVKHILERHAQVSSENVSCSVNCFDHLIYHGKPGLLSEEEQLAGKLLSAFDALVVNLRDLSDLPLGVVSVQGAGPAFSRTQVSPAHPWTGKLSAKYTRLPYQNDQSDCYYPSCDTATPPFVPVHEVVAQLESSGKWPNELNAIAKIKTSFYTYISKALRQQYGIVSSPMEGHLDILKDGFVFRLLIHYHREKLLIRESLSSASSSALRQRLALVESQLEAAPLLTSWITGVEKQHCAFSPGARLVKRWLSAQLLGNHLSQSAVEVMVASLFLQPAPYTTPATPLVTLLRFLALVADYDWPSQPLVVNFNNTLSEADIAELVKKFSQNRSSYSPMAVLTPTDQSDLRTPCYPVLSRLQLLAREGLKVIESQSADPMTLFRPSLEDYQVIIHLHQRHNPHSRPTSYTHRDGLFPVVDFDPAALYLAQLERLYSEFALFFYDQYGGSFIAVAWRPSAFTPQQFKVMKTRCHVLCDGAVVPDSEAIVADFQLLGEDLVKNIEVISYTP